MDAAEGVGPYVVVIVVGAGGAAAQGGGVAGDGLEVGAQGEDGLSGLARRARRRDED